LPGRIADTVAGAPLALLVAALALGALGVAMAARSMLATARARRLRRQRGELREDVGALSAAVLPPVPESVAGVRVDVAYRPAEGPAAGGDFHDVLELEGDRLGVVIGDVSGHGRRALGVTPLVHYTVRAYLEAGLAPREALRLADRTLEGKLGEDFATVACGIYEPAHGRFDYAVAGHPVPVLTGRRTDHAVELLTPAPIGLGPPTGFRQTSVPVGPGQSICLFSDGLVETREAADGPLLGREGLAGILASGEAEPGAQGLLDHLARTTTAGGDDMTVCLLTPEGPRGRGPVVEEVEVGPDAAPVGKLDEFAACCGLDRGQMAAVREALEGAGDGAVLRIERHPRRALWGVESAAQRLAAALPSAS
jgi:serine phosphatase RsbU (regulator of sigma subunit)